MPHNYQLKTAQIGSEKPLTCFDKTINPGYLILFVGGEKVSLLPLTFPIFDLVHVQYVCLYGTDEQLFV